MLQQRYLSALYRDQTHTATVRRKWTPHCIWQHIIFHVVIWIKGLGVKVSMKSTDHIYFNYKTNQTLFIKSAPSSAIHERIVAHACGASASCLRAEECRRMLRVMHHNGRGWWHGREELLNEVIIFVFFVHKMYSRSFITIRLIHWCHMDYFNDIRFLTTFLGLEHVSCISVYGGSESCRISSRIS